jgi:hypothetical protein
MFGTLRAADMSLEVSTKQRMTLKVS